MRERLIQDYIRDIVDAMAKAEEFVAGMDYETFNKDDRTNYAVVRAFEIIGEATKKVPSPIRKKFAAIPWKSLAGMRDKLIHDYFGFSKEVVWRTIKEDIPTVKAEMEKVLAYVTEQER
ncbi:MAG: DUF86 domain-containing protein [Candidatus Zixiibacteriota bacterium]